MADAATPRYTFATATPVPLVAAFDGGRRTSDGGLPWLAAAAALGLCAAFAACLPALAALVRQRVFRLARGCADQGDADTPRRDPLRKLVCGRVWERATHVRLRLANSHPGQALWALLAARQVLRE